MATLTWKNVDAPNFRGVADILASSQGMLTGAFDSLQKGLADYEARRGRTLGNEALLRAYQHDDPDTLQAAFNSGQIVDPRNAGMIPTSVLESIGAQKSTNLINKNRSLQNSALGYADTRTREMDSRSDAAGQVMPDILAAYASGVPGAGAQAMGKASGVLAGLEPEKLMALGERGGNIERGRINNSHTLWSNNAAVQDRYDGQDAATNLLDAYRNTLTDSARNDAVLARVDDMSPGAATAMLGMAMRNNPNFLSTIDDGGLVGSVPAPSGSESGSDWATRVGLATRESSGNTRADNGEGYVGRTQFGEARLTDARRAGVIPASMTQEQFKNNPQVQKEVEDWHFSDIDEQAKKRGLDKYYGQTIGGVTLNKDAIRGMAHIGGIGGVERFINTGGQYDPADSNKTKMSDYGKEFGRVNSQPNLRMADRAQQLENQTDIAQRRATGLSANFLKNITDETSDLEIAKAMVAPDGPFPKASLSLMASKIQELRERGAPNAATAAEIIARSTDVRTGGATIRGAKMFGGAVGSLFSNSSPHFGDDQVLNPDKVEANLNQLKSGVLISEVVDQENSISSSAYVTQLGERVKEAKKTLGTMIKASTNRLGAQGEVERAKAAVQMLEAEWRDAILRQQAKSGR